VTFSGVNFEFTIDTVMLMVAFNVALTAVHWGLGVIHNKKWGTWSDGPLKTVTFLMTMLSIILGNMRHQEKPAKEPHG
jgi:hypothetical protein